MTIVYDNVGNPLQYGPWEMTWAQGRQLRTMSKTGESWTFTYNADGMRTRKTNGATTWDYIYNGNKLMQMKKGSDTLTFSYDAGGAPMTVTHNGTTYYYVTNLQGDVVSIVDGNRNTVTNYTYDAWGNVLSTGGTMASTLGTHNPLRYRGYVYDQETGLYYLQSRYYSPTICRFISVDAYVSTGQGILGYNMFAYCLNNPVCFADPTGTYSIYDTRAIFGGGGLGGKMSPNAVLVINGGHLYNYNTSAIRMFCNSTTYVNSVTVNGGLVEGYCAIWVQNPGKNTVNCELTINGGEIKSTAAAYVNGTAELKDVASRI